jgi:hypothetical protein
LEGAHLAAHPPQVVHVRRSSDRTVDGSTFIISSQIGMPCELHSKAIRRLTDPCNVQSASPLEDQEGLPAPIHGAHQ